MVELKIELGDAVNEVRDRFTELCGYHIKISGGILDRIDSILFTTVCVAVIMVVISVAV